MKARISCLSSLVGGCVGANAARLSAIGAIEAFLFAVRRRRVEGGGGGGGVTRRRLVALSC